MIIKRGGMLLSVLLTWGLFLGCRLGQVAQGRVIEYDRNTGLITLVQESAAAKSGITNYILPPITIRVPRNPVEMGPPPEPGKLLQFDTHRRQAIIFDAKSEMLVTVSYTVVDEQLGVFADAPHVAQVAFPRIDGEKKTITLYAAQEHKLVTFTVADEYFGLPADTWRAGDEVRYYYKQPGQALRMMNVTKTDVREGG